MRQTWSIQFVAASLVLDGATHGAVHCLADAALNLRRMTRQWIEQRSVRLSRTAMLGISASFNRDNRRRNGTP
eukprot:2459609-Pyramimonas_sp.AAC.1